MENFRRKFIEEASESINNLEEALLELEVSPDNNKLIQKVFRVMHSLKGSGAMFGFEKISEFTHHLESLYDLVRNNKLALSKELFNITLLSVDHIKLLLNNEPLNSELMVVHDNINKKIIDFFAQVQVNELNETDVELVLNSIDENVEKFIPEQVSGSVASFYIKFEPFSGIFENGTNPLFLLDELAASGTVFTIVNTSQVPDIQSISPITCYTAWELVLVTDKTEDFIRDIFIFVESDSNLIINNFYEGDIFQKENVAAKLEYFRNHTKKININDLLKNNEPVVEKINIIKKNDFVEIKNETNNQKENIISTIRVSSDKLDHLMNLVSELVTTQARLSLYAEKNRENELIAIVEDVQKLSRQLRDNAFDICLIPVESMLTRFRRLVRDLSNELGKEVDFITEGTDTELDKTIIEGLMDPLLHIIRNSIDHGIENEQDRLKLSKPKIGKILFKAFYSGASVVIEISDDGRGIDIDGVRSKAIENKLITHDSVLSDKELLNLVFIAGFSTAKTVTGLSGRGVGMDVVRRKIDEIRGNVEINSKKNIGTTITIKLPLTLSIIDGLLINISETKYIIPLSVVEKIYEVLHYRVEKAFNNIIVLDGTQFPFLNLRKEFLIKDAPPSQEQMVMVKYEDKLMGILVDSVIGEYQAVLKPLGRHFKEQEIISGATILGDGTVALVMDTNKIIYTFSNSTDNEKNMVISK